MNILLVSSKKDLASNNFRNYIFENYKLLKISNNLYKFEINSKNKIYFKEIETMHIYSNEDEIYDKDIKFSQIIFLSKHSTLSDNKPSCMTVHAIGNWGTANLGGKNNCVVKTDPILIRYLLLNLRENKPIDIKKYEVKQEATHHGPYLDVSSIFYEIGSSEIDWNNKLVVKYMIEILINSIKNYDQKEILIEKNWIPVVGVGGSHYCTKFNKISLDKNTKYCFGHVVANYSIKEIKENPNILLEAKEKSNALNIIYEKEI
jgi:D-aminoacyl-tRNA deacylase